MGTVNISERLVNAGSTDLLEGNAGIRPGIVAGDALGSSKVGAIGVSMASAIVNQMAQSYSSTTGTAQQTADVVGWLLKELVRRRILEGSYVGT